MLIQEGNISFDFDEEVWSHILKYDETYDYKKIEKLDSSKAVDIIAIIQNKALVLFEIKDFRGHRIQTKPRVQNGDDPLESEVALKVRDTIAGIIGAARNSTNHATDFQTYARFFINKRKNIMVALCLEEDRGTILGTKQLQRKKANSVIFNQQLKKKLNWLTNRVFVMHALKNPFEDSLTISLP